MTNPKAKARDCSTFSTYSASRSGTSRNTSTSGIAVGGSAVGVADMGGFLFVIKRGAVEPVGAMISKAPLERGGGQRKVGCRSI